MGFWTRATLAIGASATILAACTDHPIALSEGPEVTGLSLLVVAGDTQRANAGTELAQPLVVRVVDGQNLPIANQVVNFKVLQGGGSVFGGTALTNAQGLAQDRWTLGPTPGAAQVVEARAVHSGSGAKLVFGTFRATALDPNSPPPPPPPPAAAPVATVTVTPNPASVQQGSTVQLTATLRDSAGTTLTGRTVVWTTSNSSVATVSSSGLVSGASAGSATITATSEGRSGSSTVNVTAPPPPPPPPPSGGADPIPDSNDRTFVDTRVLFQQAQNMAQADCAMKGIPASSCTSTDQETAKVGFTTNMDGQGTHALRFSWSRAASCIDDGITYIRNLSAPYPKRIFMQWKMRMGRTSTGGGIGALNSFDITNENCGNAGRKMWLTLRDVPDRGNSGRIDYIWPGGAPVNPRFDGWGGYNLGQTFQPQDHVGQTITQTIYYQAESSASANDGIIRLWINGVLMIERTGLDMGPEGFHRFQFPTTFRAPIQDQTEYWWDFLVWEPVP